jgi:hypothetical protein
MKPSLALRLAGSLLTNPKSFLAHETVLLFSHMRANTSLLGHIIGSHPEIDGYYELHMSYFSWKSLWRQKLLYLNEHALKSTSHIFFDKLLHNHCRVSPNILERRDTRAVFMLRAPEQTIRSIVNLYRKKNNDHEYTRPENAATYYIDRVNRLAELAQTMPHGYFYLDAESLIDQPDTTLRSLGDWLGLKSPLQSEYGIFEKTGQAKAGDSSEKIKSGKIDRTASDYSDIRIPEEALSGAQQAYERSRNALIGHSDGHGALLPETDHPNSIRQ